jgi:hypothetical protein
MLHKPAKIAGPARRKHKQITPAHFPHKPQSVPDASLMQLRRNIRRHRGQQSRFHFSWFGSFCKNKEGAQAAHGRKLSSLDRKAIPREHLKFR